MTTTAIPWRLRPLLRSCIAGWEQGVLTLGEASGFKTQSSPHPPSHMESDGRAFCGIPKPGLATNKSVKGRLSWAESLAGFSACRREFLREGSGCGQTE